MKAAVLGVGTELTSGQIINKNAAWISKSLKDFGVPTTAHLVVPDDRALIMDALKFCEGQCDTLFVTGGLGPTTDDFTRDLISEWSRQPLEFHEASWEHIRARLSSRSIEIRETQRQQCMYPKGAIVITNPDGTANAFQMKVGKLDVFVLPGPPREIEACWNNGIQDFLKDKAKHIDKILTYSWETMGLGESDISHMTETCLEGVEVEKGYRVHMPYVEVKMSFLESQKSKLLPYVEKLDKTLGSLVITRNGEDMASMLAKQLSEIGTIHFVDTCTGAVLLERLSPVLRKVLSQKQWSFGSDELPSADFQSVKLSLRSLDATRATATLHHKGASYQDTFEAPTFMARLSDRKASFFAEKALVFWHQSLARIHS